MGESYIHIDRDVFLEAFKAASSKGQMARSLGIHKDTLHRIAAEYNVDLSKIAKKSIEKAKELPTAEQVRRDIQLDVLNEKVRQWKGLYKEARSAIRTQEEFLAEVCDSCALVPFEFELYEPVIRDDSKPSRQVVLHISDWQMGQKVSKADTGDNVYNWEIMLGKRGRYFEGVVGSIKNIMRSYNIDCIWYCYGGDMIEGYKVFAEQGYQLDRDAGAQTVEGAMVWGEFELAMEQAFPGIPKRRRAVGGNHGVPEGRKGGAVTSTINYEYMWYELLRYQTQNLPMVDTEYATHGRLIFDVAEQPVLLTHGDEIRGQLGIPFYGIRTGWMKHTQEVGHFRYWIFGHIHQTSMVTYGNGAALSNGDAVGFNNLTGKLRNPSSTPMQSVYFFSRERGLDEVSYIHL